jgi:GNAT superfamily N-acetyltransferase
MTHTREPGVIISFVVVITGISMILQIVNLVPMKREDIPGAVDLIRIAMNEDEADWADVTMHHHFGCVENSLDDGRHYFVWKNGSKVHGIVGLHQYNWGPTENIWLGWFALDPDLHGKGLGSELFDRALSRAKEMRFRKLFIETYASQTFEKARRFYEKKGFEQIGKIENYLPDGEAMIVYLKVIGPET